MKVRKGKERKGKERKERKGRCLCGSGRRVRVRVVEGDEQARGEQRVCLCDLCGLRCRAASVVARTSARRAQTANRLRSASRRTVSLRSPFLESFFASRVLLDVPKATGRQLVDIHYACRKCIQIQYILHCSKDSCNNASYNFLV